jgi:hypothetical protein
MRQCNANGRSDSTDNWGFNTLSVDSKKIRSHFCQLSIADPDIASIRYLREVSGYEGSLRSENRSQESGIFAK